ncbi:eCIS core domain-containing protein [Methylocaldum sp. MU1018]
METARAKTVNRAAAVQPAAAAPIAVRNVPPRVQTAMKVSSPKDPAEREADVTAKKIMRMAVPDSSVAYVKTGSGGVFRQIKKDEKEKKLQAKLESPYIARFAASGVFAKTKKEEDTIQRKAEGQPNVASNVAADIRNSMTAGQPLPLSVRRFMEPRFKADFGNVRMHTGDNAAKLNRQVNAKAFAVGNHIFFGKDQFRPESQEGRELIAHELTHTIQQGGAVQRSEDVGVTQQTPAGEVQRLGIGDALDYFADKANLIPGFRMFTIILGVNPINMSRVERSAANILRALIEFIPGGGLITQALDNYGVFDRVGTWVEQQIRALGMTGAVIRDAINQFLDSLSWTDIFDLGGVWNRAKRIFTAPIDQIIRFAGGLVSGILRLIKEAILRPLARLAEGTRGYDLLKAVLGQDPITGDPVPRTADTLIGGFMKLIGQEEVWNNLKRANAVARAWAWFQSALGGLLGFVRQIPVLFVTTLQSLEIADIVLLPRAFAKVGSAFAGFLGQFMSWAGQQVMNLLQIIFEVVAPGAMPYIRRAAGAFRSIIRNPIGFVGNLVRAGVLGFRRFAANFLTHLRTSLINWLTGTLSGAGVYIPQAFTLREIIKFVLSVLGLTWQNIRQKLVRVIGETAVRALETGFDLVVALVTQGPAAAWEKIQESLSNLREMVMEQVMTFVRDHIVQAAITRLVTSLNPAGAFIQAIIATYNTIMFFVERLRQIAQVAMSFIDSISAIAGGVIAAAASRVERTMAGLLTLVISFLARIAGLGRVSDAVVNIVNRVRQPIDRALDRVVDWIVAQARRLGRLAAGGGPQPAGAAGPPQTRPGDGEIGETLQFTAGEEGHRLWIDVRGESAEVMLASTPKPLSRHLAEFRTDARDIDDDTTRSRVLGWIGAALPLARSIEADARRAASRQIDTPQREALDARIEANEATLRPILANILDALRVRVPARIDPALRVRFTTYPGIDLGEYARQLGMQQSAINAMVVEDWLANRMRFAERRAFTGSGRHPESRQAQQDLRARTRVQLILRLTRGISASGPVVSAINADPHLAAFVAGVFARYSPTTRRNGLAESTASREVDAWMSTQHALHSPDQVAGGRHDQLTGLGSGAVNVDIGKNWGGFEKPVHLANQLERDTRDAMRRLNVRRAFWRQVRMNVTLTT